MSAATPAHFYVYKLVLLVANVLFLIGIESQVADRSHQTVDTTGNHGQEDVGTSSAGKAFGLQGGMIDNQATDPAQEKSQQKTNQIIVIHCDVLLSLKLFGL